MIPWNFRFYDRNCIYAKLQVLIVIVLLLHIVVIDIRYLRIFSLTIKFHCAISIDENQCNFSL